VQTCALPISTGGVPGGAWVGPKLALAGGKGTGCCPVGWPTLGSCSVTSSGARPLSTAGIEVVGRRSAPYGSAARCGAGNVPEGIAWGGGAARRRGCGGTGRVGSECVTAGGGCCIRGGGCWGRCGSGTGRTAGRDGARNCGGSDAESTDGGGSGAGGRIGGPDRVPGAWRG